MSQLNEFEIRDIFDCEHSGVNHFLPFQDGEQTIKSVTFSDSRKKSRYEVGNGAGTSKPHEDPADGSVLLRKDGSLLSLLKEESSTILDNSCSLISEKVAPALQITKCIIDSTGLACQEAKISASSFRKIENDTRNTTLCSDYLSPGKRDFVHHCRVGDTSSVDSCLGVLTKKQRDGVDDLLFNDCPKIGDLEDFDKMFRNIGSTFAQGNTVTKDDISWISSSSHGFHGVEDTLQSVVLSSVSELSALNSTSDSNGLCTNILSATDLSSTSHKMPPSTGCGSFPLYPDAERKGKSILSELVYDDVRIADKSSTLEEVVYGIRCSDPNMINMTPKEHLTSKRKEFKPALGSTIQSSSSGCGFIQSGQDQELVSSVLSSPQPSPLQFFSKQNLLPEPFASNCLQSYNLQAQMSGLLTLQHVPPVQTALKTSLIESSALPHCATSNHPSSYNPQPIGMLPGSLSMPSTMSLEENEKFYARQQFPAPLVIDKTPKEHATAINSCVQRTYKFHDEVGGDKDLDHTILSLPAVNIGSSTSQDNSYMTSTLFDDVSSKAASFQQLQMIMDRLGIKTKLCIRDSLYRLARSAEQRHNYGTANDVSFGRSLLRGFQDGKELRPPDSVHVPTSTNAIERAVSYLLFHKSLESETGTADDTLLPRPSLHIHGSVGSQV